MVDPPGKAEVTLDDIDEGDGGGGGNEDDGKDDDEDAGAIATQLVTEAEISAAEVSDAEDSLGGMVTVA